MNFPKETEKDITVIKVNLSKATMKEAGELKNTVAESLSNGSSKFIIDFSQCEFMDSTFISALINSLKNVSKVNGKLFLANVHSESMSLMELTGTSKVFSFYPTVKDALKSFQ
ncbi:MAG: STAS domain-containing protein [Ignavibacteriales bacterium]|nr:MAG: STAS domain-containing protein [Ignavibacteriales bacterium]